MDIETFVSSIGSTGIAKTNRFLVHIVAPVQSDQNDTSSTSTADLMLRCENVVFPGRRAVTEDLLVYGPIRKVAYTSIYETTTMTIMLSEDMREKLFFERWQNKAIGDASVGDQSAGMFDIGYYRDYCGSVEIWQISEMDDIKFKCKLMEAWPLSVLNMSADWNINAMQKIKIEIAYRYYISEKK